MALIPLLDFEFFLLPLLNLLRQLRQYILLPLLLALAACGNSGPGRWVVGCDTSLLLYSILTPIL